jgi:hypothetical protein
MGDASKKNNQPRDGDVGLSLWDAKSCKALPMMFNSSPLVVENSTKYPMSTSTSGGFVSIGLPPTVTRVLKQSESMGWVMMGAGSATLESTQ